MAKKVTTLFIRDNVINLLVMRGKRVEKWASLPLEAGLVSQGLVLDEARVAGEVKKLFKTEKVSTGKVIVGLSGRDSLYRIIALPELPEDILPEAIKREAGRALPVSLSEVHLSYQLVPAPKGETRVFLAASPRSTTDALLRTMRQAGIEPYIMDLAPLALCRVPDEPRAIIVNARLDHLDIMVISERLPQVIRRVPLPGEAESLSEKLPAITEEFGRTVAFYNSSHEEKPLDSTVPVFVSGELADAPESWQSVVGELGYSVSLLPLPVEFPEGFSPNEFMVNIGLAFKELLLEKGEVNFSLVNLNVLPGTFQPKAVWVGRILAGIGIIIGIALLGYAGFLLHDSAAWTADLRSQIAPIESQVSQEREEIAALREQVQQTEAPIGQIEDTTGILNTTFASLEDSREKADGDSKEIVSLLPGLVNLTEINHEGARVTVRGIVLKKEDIDDIFRFARDLRSSDRFAVVVISSIQENVKQEEEVKGFKFELLLK